MSEAKDEQQSTETLSFRCWCERCRLCEGAESSKAERLNWAGGEGLTVVQVL